MFEKRERNSVLKLCTADGDDDASCSNYSQQVKMYFEQTFRIVANANVMLSFLATLTLL